MANTHIDQSGQTVEGNQANVGRDVGHIGDKVEGDKIGGDKIVNIYMTPGEEEIPQQSFEPDMVLIGGGPFWMGRPEGEGISEFETPQHAVSLPDFAISRYPITNDGYKRFIRANTDHEPPAGWFNRKPPEGREDHPDSGVTWFDAVAYCDWLFNETKRRYRLPSEAEWEKAASWIPDLDADEATRSQKRLYPWGSEWAAGRCNVGGEGTVRATEYEEYASAYGVVDLLGNVQEWTRSLWGSDTRAPQFRYPYDAQDEDREVDKVEDLPAQMRVVYRGGSYRTQADAVSNTHRGKSDPSSKVGWRGFRVVLPVKESS